MPIFPGRKIQNYPNIERFIQSLPGSGVHGRYTSSPDSLETLMWEVGLNPLHIAYEILVYQEQYEAVDALELGRAIKDCFDKTDWTETYYRQWDAFDVCLKMDKSELALRLADAYFDLDVAELSLFYYKMVLKCEECKGPAEMLETDALKRYTKALCNLGLIYCGSGEINTGLEFMEKAYNLYPSHHILVTYLRAQLELNQVSFEKVEETYISRLLTDHDDFVLNFLVWFFDRKGDEEEAITSFMQLSQGRAQLQNLHCYMNYMIHGNRETLMNRYLETLMAEYPLDYYVVLMHCYLEEQRFDAVTAVIENFENNLVFKQLLAMQPMDPLQDRKRQCEKNGLTTMDRYFYIKAKAQYLRKQIIPSIESVNRVNVNNLTDSEKIDYYLLLADLSKVSSYIHQEQKQYVEILNLLSERYRQLFLSI